MIKVKGCVATFTGKDAEWLTREAKTLGMSKQNFFTGCMWEAIMKHARNGGFIEKDKKGMEA